MICIDRVSGKKVLMDNHKPKGPHYHINSNEFGYEFESLDQLIIDFRNLIFAHLGVQL